MLTLTMRREREDTPNDASGTTNHLYTRGRTTSSSNRYGLNSPTETSPGSYPSYHHCGDEFVDILQVQQLLLENNANSVVNYNSVSNSAPITTTSNQNVRRLSTNNSVNNYHQLSPRPYLDGYHRHHGVLGSSSGSSAPQQSYYFPSGLTTTGGYTGNNNSVDDLMSLWFTTGGSIQQNVTGKKKKHFFNYLVIYILLI